MKKYILITIGFTPPTPEVMKPWMEWFKSIEGKMVNHFGFNNGKEVKPDNSFDLPMDKEALTGCVIINAENMEEALEIAKKSPMVTSTKVYEIKEA